MCSLTLLCDNGCSFWRCVCNVRGKQQMDESEMVTGELVFVESEGIGGGKNV